MKKILVSTMIAFVLLISGTMESAAEPMGDLVIPLTSLGEEAWSPASSPAAQQSAALAIYDSILTLSSGTGEIVAAQGGVAKNFSWSSDRKTLSIELYKGVPFHDGWGEVTSKDVEYSFDIAMSESSKNNHANKLRNFIDRIEINDQHNLKIYLKVPGWDFLDELVDVFFHIPVASKKYVESVGLEKAAQRPIGSGPFKFKEHVFGDHVTVEAVEDHWYKTPRLKTITWKKVSDPAVKLAMLKAGEAHVTNITYDQIEDAKKSGLKIKPMIGVNMLTVQFLGMYQKATYKAEDTPPWAKGKWWEKDSSAHKVRKALSLAIDREAIVKYGLHGFGSTEHASVSPYYPGTMGFDSTKTVTPYDPDKALKLLREAGYAKPSDLKIVVDLTPHSNRPYNKPIGEAIAAMWEQLGISVETRLSTDYKTLIGLMRNRSAFYAWTWAAPRFSRAPALVNLIGGEKAGGNMFGDAPELSILLKEGNNAESIDKLISNSKALNDYLYEYDMAPSVAYSANLYTTVPNFVWPSKPGLAGNAYHNYAEMYFK